MTRPPEKLARDRRAVPVEDGTDLERPLHFAGRTHLNGLLALVLYEDAEQACALATVTLPYDPATRRVLRGLYRGMDLRGAESMEVGHLLKTYALVRARTVTLRPWWRGWRRTPAVVLTPTHPFEVPF